MRKNPKTAKKEALKAIKRIRELSDRYPSQFDGMTQEQIIAKLRETREKLWEEKIAFRT